MNPNSPNPPSDMPIGLRCLLDASYADLIPEEYAFSELMRAAYEAGVLVCPQIDSVQ